MLVPTLLALGALLGASALFAWLLRGAGLPGGALGAALVGGVMGGVLLGPAALGRTNPALTHRVMLQDAGPIDRLHEIDQRLTAERVALLAADVPEHERLAREAELLSDRALAFENRLDALVEGRRRIGAPVVGLSALAICLVLLAGRRPPSPLRALAIGAPVLLAELLLVSLGVRLLFGLGPLASAALGAATAGGSAFVILDAINADHARPTRLARSVSLGVLLGASLVLVASARGLVPILTLSAIPLGVLAGMLIGTPTPMTRRLRRLGAAITLYGAVPLSAAFVSVRLDPATVLATTRSTLLLVAIVLGGGCGVFLALRHLGSKALAPDAEPIGATTWALRVIEAGWQPTGAILLAGGVAFGPIDPHDPLGAAACAGVLLNATINQVLLPPTRRLLTDSEPVGATTPPRAETEPEPPAAPPS